MAAAVADYRPPAPSAAKRPKDGAPWTVELEPTTDVLAALGADRTPGQVLVGLRGGRRRSRVSSERARSGARRTPTSSSSTTSAAPDIGFDAPDNEVVVVSRRTASGVVAKAPKRAVAAAVLDEVERLLSSR